MSCTLLGVVPGITLPCPTVAHSALLSGLMEDKTAGCSGKGPWQLYPKWTERTAWHELRITGQHNENRQGQWGPAQPCACPGLLAAPGLQED